MTDMQWQDEGYECLEPELGETLWRLDTSELTDDERCLLEDHVEICDACRLRRDMAAKVGRRLADSSLLLPSDLPNRSEKPPGMGRIVKLRLLGSAGGAALAAGLALAFILPPAHRDHDLVSRAGIGQGFVRPVEGEVVPQRPLTISWLKISGASKYRISVEELEGAFRWYGETQGLSVTMPAEIDLPEDKDYRVQLETIPADLVQAGEVNVSFKTADLRSYVRYRLSAAGKSSRLLFYGGLATMLGSIVFLVRRKH